MMITITLFYVIEVVMIYMTQTEVRKHRKSCQIDIFLIYDVTCLSIYINSDKVFSFWYFLLTMVCLKAIQRVHRKQYHSMSAVLCHFN